MTLPALGAGIAALPAAACARTRPRSFPADRYAVATGGARTGLIIAVFHESMNSKRADMFCNSTV